MNPTMSLAVSEPVTPAVSPQPSRKHRQFLTTDLMKRDTDLDDDVTVKRLYVVTEAETVTIYEKENNIYLLALNEGYPAK